ncbi:MAG: hypothetical protein FJ392_13500 [Verrucomicrobia bacterium]|nr:hypothetical protein [Verrucomicrobiota bacterium]
MRAYPTLARLLTLLLAFAAIGAVPAAQPTTDLPKPIATVVESLGPTVQAAIWFGPPEGAPTVTWQARRPMPAASAIKVAHLIEVCAARAKAAAPLPVNSGAAAPATWLEVSLSGTAAILAEPAHPAVAHFTPDQRATAERLLGGRSILGVCEAMIHGRDVDNATYNLAANLVTAHLGGPAALTRSLHARDPRFGGLQVRRYMLADRRAHGDNEVTAEALAALHAALALGRVPGLDAASVAACRRVLADGKDAAGRAVFRKDGALNSAPVARTRAGWREGAEGARVFVILLSDSEVGAATGQKLEEAALRIESLLFAAP